MNNTMSRRSALKLIGSIAAVATSVGAWVAARTKIRKTDQLTDFTNYMRAHVQAKDAPMIIVCGQTRSGKTTVIKELTQHVYPDAILASVEGNFVYTTRWTDGRTDVSTGAHATTDAMRDVRQLMLSLHAYRGRRCPVFVHHPAAREVFRHDAQPSFTLTEQADVLIWTSRSPDGRHYVSVLKNRYAPILHRSYDVTGLFS